MPWMRYIPSALAPWKRKTEQVYERYNGVFQSYFDHAQKDGVPNASAVSPFDAPADISIGRRKLG